jgi:hypothetical protein
MADEPGSRSILACDSRQAPPRLSFTRGSKWKLYSGRGKLSDEWWNSKKPHETMKASRKSQAWISGDVFTVPLLDNSRVYGQIVAKEDHALNSVSCAFFDLRCMSSEIQTPSGGLPNERIFSVYLLRGICWTAEFGVLLKTKRLLCHGLGCHMKV